MDWYQQFYKTVNKRLNEHFSVDDCFILLVEIMADTESTTKQDFIDVRNAYYEYLRSVNNESITRTISAV